MLESLFKYAEVLGRMRRGPLSDEIDAIAADLIHTGYARVTTRRYLSLAASFSRYAARVGCPRSNCIDRDLVDRFLVEFPKSAGTRSVARTALFHTMRYLVQRYPRSAESLKTDDPDEPLLAAFDTHLREVRGLQSRTIEGIVLRARRLVQWYRGARPGRPLSALRGEDILRFALDLAGECVADGTRSEAVSHVRTFLRYLRVVGVLEADLARLVPRVPSWRMARVPEYLSWPQVRAAIEAIDTKDATGKRDRALLVVLATTGLRSQDVRQIELRDVRWRVGESHVRRTKSRRERVLPLIQEAGSALADHVLHGRPQIADPTLFLRHVPPVGPLRFSSTLAAIVRRRLARCGIRPKRAGAHLFRHSLATRMVQQQLPVKAVADMMGHRSIDTTAVYVKVALPQLETVALAFPGCAS